MDREQIINENAGLIYKISQKFYGTEKEDLYQAGVLGLLKAFKNYKQNDNCKFSSYAYEYIYGEMYQLVNNKQIKLNKNITKLYRAIENAKNILYQNYGKPPSEEEIAEFLQIDKAYVDEAILASESILSLDNDDEMSLYETIKTDEKINVDDKIFLNEGLSSLSEDERNIIHKRYYEDLTQSEVAKSLAMTQVMVSRYEKRGLSKMQAYLTR